MEIGKVFSIRDLFGYLLPGGMIVICFLVIKHWIKDLYTYDGVPEVNFNFLSQYSPWTWIIIGALSIILGFMNAAIMKGFSDRMASIIEANSKTKEPFEKKWRKITMGLISEDKGLWIVNYLSATFSSTIKLKDVYLDEQLIHEIVNYVKNDLLFYSNHKQPDRIIKENIDLIYECRDQIYLNNQTLSDSVIIKHIDRLSSKEQLLRNLMIPIMVFTFIMCMSMYKQGSTNIYISLFISTLITLLSFLICKKSHTYWRMSWAQEVFLIYYLTNKNKNSMNHQ